MSRAAALSFPVPAPLVASQHRASDPAASIWVSANAGSGKTHVLTQRVIRLLLGGVPPAKILCLTFTKAAAAQMATRVFGELSKWTQLDDAKLHAAILETGSPAPDAAGLLRARRLFTRTVETPGGLKIQTIHAFCERLLHLFPFEANVPARFEVADERRTEEMLSLAKRDVIAAMKGTAPLTLVADAAGSFGVHRVIADAMKLRAAARRAGPGTQAELAAQLGTGSFASVEDVQREMLWGGLQPSRWGAIAEALETGGKTDKQNASRLRGALVLLGDCEAPSPLLGAGGGGRSRASSAAGMRTKNPHPYPSPQGGGGPDGNARSYAEALEAYRGVFLGKELTPRSRLLTNAVAAAHPSLPGEMQVEAERLASLGDQLKAAETVERTEALIEIVDAVMDRYDHAKVAQGLLDFDDLVERTLALLEHSDSGWVLHKLDAGIDHVLVDEAQDTSEAQWKILERLTGDFAAGATARTQDRSFFVVGDDKQSIFSFQGAAPLMFDEMRTNFERRFKAGRKTFERVELKTSFRSVPGILSAVDTVFKPDSHRDGLVSSPALGWPTHESIKAKLPGLVEIWPRLGAQERDDPTDWSIPVDTPSEHDPVSVVADRVARKIKALTAKDSPDRVHDGRSETSRPIQAGDILVLVRTRGAFFEAVIRALKHHHVEVAGADRLDVANHIAVMDLVAAGRTALLPTDDLSLACLLKSPLFGLTDDDLITLAPGRRGPLFSALAASPDASHRGAHATIQAWSARATATTPFAFYVELLGRDGGRRRMEARLGPEAHDAIDEFLRLALAHEQQGPPSLGAFLADVEALESSIRRDMEAPGDSVRVMTVHAAKGLEAKIVFLPDTCAVPAPTLDPTVFDLNEGTGRPPLVVWSPRKGDDPPRVEQARAEKRQATMREYRRLLYVALTRAEERLYIAGYFNTRQPPDDCWEAMIDRSLSEGAEEAEAFWGDGDMVKRIVTPGAGTAAVPGQRPLSEQRGLPLTPDWLGQSVETPARPPPLRPSRLRASVERTSDASGRDYGIAMHLLLQHLPGQPADRHEAAARAFLAARTATVAETLHPRLVAEARAVMALPDLRALFSPEARAEVAVIGTVPETGGGLRQVRGTIDRLAVTADRVIVADFKTGTPEHPPPRAYVEQMALYERVLAPLWRDRRLVMLLVWTQTPQVVELDAAALDAVAAAIVASA